MSEVDEHGMAGGCQGLIQDDRSNLPTGAELSENCNTVSKASQDCVLFIGTSSLATPQPKHKIKQEPDTDIKYKPLFLPLSSYEEKEEKTANPINMDQLPDSSVHPNDPTNFPVFNSRLSQDSPKQESDPPIFLGNDYAQYPFNVVENFVDSPPPIALPLSGNTIASLGLQCNIKFHLCHPFFLDGQQQEGQQLPVGVDELETTLSTAVLVNQLKEALGQSHVVHRYHEMVDHGEP
ncbi:hypothetical protein C8J57DRAFT_1240660 [Mycena rebaudengoi]|nr:hypothetical protein C8J57DRAFT_1240660 [Mycena rebaudengoi]